MGPRLQVQVPVPCRGSYYSAHDASPPAQVTLGHLSLAPSLKNTLHPSSLQSKLGQGSRLRVRLFPPLHVASCMSYNLQPGCRRTQKTKAANENENESNQAKPSFCRGPVPILLVRPIKRFCLCTNVRGEAKKKRTKPEPFNFNFCTRCGQKGLAPLPRAQPVPHRPAPRSGGSQPPRGASSEVSTSLMIGRVARLGFPQNLEGCSLGKSTFRFGFLGEFAAMFSLVIQQQRSVVRWFPRARGREPREV